MRVRQADTSYYRRAKSILGRMDVDYEAEISCTALEERLGCILQLLEGFQPGKVLDIGCRRGIIGSAVQEEFKALVYGVDMDESELVIAKQRNLRTTLHNVDQEELPFEDGVFDLIILAEVVEHLARPNHCLSEIHRVLKPGATLIITTPNLTSLPNRVKFCRGEDPTQISDKDFGNIHKREYNLQDLKLFLEWHDFDITELIFANYRAIGSKQGLLYKSIVCRLWPSLSPLLIIKAQSRQGRRHVMDEESTCGPSS